MNTIERILSLVSENKITKNKLLTDLGLGKNSFVNWQKRNTSPSGETLAQISSYFHVSTDYLLGRTDEKKPTPVSESGPSDDDLIRLWSSLSPDEILRMKDFALGMIANRKSDSSLPE